MALTRIGVISDTHGLLRPEALAELKGNDLILHAGDIGDGAILSALSDIAPTHAVRGNNDVEPWAKHIKALIELEIDGCHITMLHDLALLKKGKGQGGVVITGHSHKPLIEQRGDTLMLNPGSAGPRRFSLPISLAQLVIEDGRATARIVELVALPVTARIVRRANVE